MLIGDMTAVKYAFPIDYEIWTAGLR